MSLSRSDRPAMSWLRRVASSPSPAARRSGGSVEIESFADYQRSDRCGVVHCLPAASSQRLAADALFSRISLGLGDCSSRDSFCDSAQLAQIAGQSQFGRDSSSLWIFASSAWKSIDFSRQKSAPLACACSTCSSSAVPVKRMTGSLLHSGF